ncbi:MAG: DEAD/DEAH box helicase family protein, partial [Blautia sp.]|nr:DEAD/DEAH box helicase family protein [Blautia sp.]
IAEKFLSVLTDLPELELARGEVEVPLTEDTVSFLLERTPFALGSEHVDEAWLSSLFGTLRGIFSREIAKYEGTVNLYLTEKSQKLKVPERVFFHLVEHPKTPDTPFAFLATYATKDENGKVRHRPLSYALTEMEGSREQLLSLLSCLKGAGEACPMISSFMQSGELFHPLRLTSQEAYTFLRAIPDIEQAGILCRVPNWWKKRSSSVSLSIVLGESAPSFVGADALLSMKPRLMVNGEYLTEEEIAKILSESDGLALIKGKWVEVDREKLKKLLEQMKGESKELSLFEALRMQAGLSGKKEDADVGNLLTNGQWLSSLFKKLRTPTALEEQEVSSQVSATLRPYQRTGYSWLCAMQSLGFGACLADDMGLGKTLQVLTWLERLKEEDPKAKVLLVVPASLLGNWQKEAERFTPHLTLLLLHGSSSKVLGEVFAKEEAFLTITTYSMVSRIEALHDYSWTAVILDEAQAIKNPGTKQTRSVKELKTRYRIALTGTPIENDLTNLWSLFDFLNKGLLGSSAEFKRYAKALSENPDRYVRLKSMVSPFILRRLKTDKSIINDLPEKIEAKDYVPLTKRQLVLYRKLVEELRAALLETGETGIQRKGLV